MWVTTQLKILIVNAVEWSEEYLRIPYQRDVFDWIRTAFGENPEGFLEWQAQKDKSPPEESFDAVVVSGSAASAFDREAWIGRLSDAILGWADVGMPILGICFGHQIVARALGGRVERNPIGWEVGTQPLELTVVGSHDPLFESITSPLDVMQSHRDIVVEAPQGAVTLASSPSCEHQSLAIGDNIRTIQFHPEYTIGHMTYLVGPRKPMLTEAGVDFEVMQTGIRETPESRRVLSNFNRNFIEKFIRRETDD